MDTNDARKSSEVEDGFPYGWPGIVCYFTAKRGQVQQLACRDDMRDAVRAKQRIWAVWPGQWKSDVFLIDEPEKLPK